MSRAQRTIVHATIRQWVEARGGSPAHGKRTGNDGDPGILRIDYPGYSGGESLERMQWDEWLEAFEQNELAFLFVDEDDSRFSKLVLRRDEDEATAGGARAGGGRSGGGSDGATAKQIASQVSFR